MKKNLIFAFSLLSLFAPVLRAQPSPEPSGIFQGLTLGVDTNQGVVTGYYQELLEAPNLPHLDCSFYLSGKKNGDHYEVQAWSPTDKKPRVTTGQLSFFTTGNPRALLKLDKLDRDCAAIRPTLGKDSGASLAMSRSAAWTQVRVVANSQPFYHQNPDPASPTSGSAKRGMVVTVTERRSDWALVQVEQKTKGWLKEGDFYPTTPTEEKPIEPVPQPKAARSPAPAPAPVSAATATPKLEPKASLIEQLKTLNEAAFDLALRVLNHPEQRNTLSARRSQMEKELDGLASRLIAADPLAYASESKEIFETFLDLQYVKQAQSVVSLRMNQKILERAAK